MNVKIDWRTGLNHGRARKEFTEDSIIHYPVYLTVALEMEFPLTKAIYSRNSHNAYFPYA